MITKQEFDASLQHRYQELKEKFSDLCVFSFPVNLDQAGRRWNGALIFGQKALYSMSVDGNDEANVYFFDKISDVRYDSFPGGGICEIFYCGQWQVLCRAFSEEKESISQLVRILREVIDGVLIPKEAKFVYRMTVCPICHRPLLHGATTCNVCSDKKGLWKKLWQLIKPQYPYIILSIVLFGVTSALNLLLPTMQKYFVDNYLTTSVPEQVLQSFSAVLFLVASMAVLRVVITGVSILRNVILVRVGNRTVVELRKQIYSKIQKLSVAGISRHTAGDLMNRVSSDTNVISNFVTNHIPTLLEQAVLIVSIIFVLIFYSWKLALFIMLPVPFVVYLFRYIWNRNRKLYHRHWVENSNANTVLHDVFQGVRVVKVFGTEKNEIEKYDHAVSAQRDIAIRNETAWAKVVPYADFIIQIGHFILLYFVGNEILDGRMTFGDMTMLSSFVSMVYGPIRSMASVPRVLQQAMTSVSKVFEVIDEEPDVPDRKDAIDLKIRGQIDIDRIWFGYNENENVLEDVSVSVGPGEMLGIVGRSGAGKSTLINLVMRLYDVQRGSIFIDGVDVRDISQHSLRSQIGVVLQETFLFSGTIFHNLIYAKPDATYEEVIEAARLANAHEFIMKLPDGYNTYVGERGYTLSGGERQRIAIARAVLHNPKILILDEATSALDTETEKMIQDALQKLCQNRTTIAIAHRLSTLRNATKILVIDKKTVAELGTHDELLNQEGGIYQSLVIAQREMSSIKKKAK